MPFLLATGGLVWAAALLAAAFIAPVYHGETASPGGGTVRTTDTLVGVNGLWVVWLLCIPLFLALTAWMGLRLRCSRGSVWGSRLAWAAVALLWAFALIGSASVGLFFSPCALLLLLAADRTPAAGDAPPA